MSWSQLVSSWLHPWKWSQSAALLMWLPPITLSSKWLCAAFFKFQSNQSTPIDFLWCSALNAPLLCMCESIDPLSNGAGFVLFLRCLSDQPVWTRLDSSSTLCSSCSSLSHTWMFHNIPTAPVWLHISAKTDELQRKSRPWGRIDDNRTNLFIDWQTIRSQLLCWNVKTRP